MVTKTNEGNPGTPEVTPNVPEASSTEQQSPKASSTEPQAPEGAATTPDAGGQTPSAPAPKPENPKKADPYEELAKEYAKHYPGNTTFHITTDKQVFLKGDRNFAVLHQGTLKTDEKIHSITVKR